MIILIKYIILKMFVQIIYVYLVLFSILYSDDFPLFLNGIV